MVPDHIDVVDRTPAMNDQGGAACDCNDFPGVTFREPVEPRRSSRIQGIRGSQKEPTNSEEQSSYAAPTAKTVSRKPDNEAGEAPTVIFRRLVTTSPQAAKLFLVMIKSKALDAVQDWVSVVTWLENEAPLNVMQKFITAISPTRGPDDPELSLEDAKKILHESVVYDVIREVGEITETSTAITECVGRYSKLKNASNSGAVTPGKGNLLPLARDIVGGRSGRNALL